MKKDRRPHTAKKHVLFSLPFRLLYLVLLLRSTSVQGQFSAPDTVAWGTAASQPYTVNEAQGKVVNNKLYTFGGFDSQKSGFTPTKRSYVYDPVANTWTPIADLPHTPNGDNFGGITHAGIATDGTNIYLAGGYTANAAGTGQIFGTNQVWRYNVAQNTYTQMPNLPVSISAGQMEYLNGKLYHIAGTNPSRTENLGTVYVLDLNNVAAGWSQAAAMPNPRHHGGSAVVGGKIYYIGGQHGHDGALVAQKDVHAYDPATNTWSKVADLPVPDGASGRGHITSSVVVLNNRIVVIAGETVHNSGRTNMVSLYDPATNTWSNLTPLPATRYSGVAALLNNYLYYTGGSGSKVTYKGLPFRSTNVVSLPALADAFVHNGAYAGYNYGTDTSILVKTYTPKPNFTRYAYLKFHPTASTILSARLRVYGRNTENTSATALTVSGVNNDAWTETGITWNNAPAAGATLGTISVNNVAKYYELDVTDFVKAEAAGDQIVSFIIRDTANKNRILSFNSKEHAANPPQLFVISESETLPTGKSLVFNQSSQSVEVEQGASQTLPEYIATTDGTPVTAKLNAIDNNGVVPTWLSVNGEALDGINYTTGSEITFDFDATNLSIGQYTAKVTASATGYNNALLTILLTVKAGANGALADIKVNFQDSLTVPPAGWLVDFGQPYGPRTQANQGTGNNYGWLTVTDNTPLNLVRNSRKRNTPADVLLKTFIHMQGNHNAGNFNGVKVEGKWEAQVANGNYDVTVAVGDDSYTDSKHSINVEGVPAIVSFVPSAAEKFKLATVSVTVADGFLTVDAAGGTNTKINYIIIQPSTTKRPSVVLLNPENNSLNVSENTSVSTSILNLPNGGINNSTLTASSVYLKEALTGDLVPANVNGTGGGDAITLVPAEALKLNTTYTLYITDEVKDLSGASFIPFSSSFTTNQVSSGSVVTAKFEKVALPNTVGRHSSLTVGPDGKLYALSIDGVIKRFVINADGTLGDPELLYSLQDASGTRQQRLAIGFAFDPASTATNLIAWVTHSTFKFLSGPDLDGKLTKLSGANLQNVQDVLINLPRSAKDHLTNSVAFGPDGALYFTQGSNSAMGKADKTWSNREETLLSGAVLRLDPTKLTTLPLDVKTPERGGTYSPYSANAPLTIYGSGVRNAYDLVWHSNGELYVPTNGSAAGGNTPSSVAGTLRPDGSAYNDSIVPSLTSVQQTQKDLLFKVRKGGYYGHPNPYRGEYVLNGGNPTSAADPAQVDQYPVGTMPDKNWRGYAFDFQTNKSPNGAIEYKSSAFDGALKGKLMVVRYSQHDDIITLTPGGPDNDIVSYSQGTSIQGFSGFVDPLDLTEDVATGNIYVSEYGGNGKITLLRASAPAIVSNGKIEVTPNKFYDNDVKDTIGGTPRIFKIKNTGTGVLTVSSLSVSGANAAQFKLGSLPAMPLKINAGDSAAFTVAFNASAVGVQTALVTINSNDTSKATLNLPLRGLGTAGLGGSNEPSLQAILNLMQIPVVVGDDDAATAVINSNATLQKTALLGEEVSMQSFVKAGSGNVTIEPLAVFGPTNNNPVTGMGWYTTKNTNSKQLLFTVGNSPTSNGQTVRAAVNGSLSFDPGTAAFGFYSYWPYFSNRHLYSEDSFNVFTGTIPHHVRVYPYKDSAGVVANAYIVAFEETTSGIDYQDLVFVVKNVKSAVQSYNVTVEPIADAMVRKSTGTTNYGTETTIPIKSTPSGAYTRTAYFKFSLNGITDVKSAKLRLYGYNSEGTAGVKLYTYGVNNDAWAEQTITWNTAPPASTPMLDTISVNNQAKYYELDVSSYVKTQLAVDKTVTLMISDPEIKEKMLIFNSRENGANRPQLVIETTGESYKRNNMLFVENLDRFPSNDLFVTSRIQVPWTRDSIYNSNHDTARVRIHNKGVNALVVSKLQLSNTKDWSIVKFRGVAYDSTTALPILLNPGTYADAIIAFKAVDSVTTSRYKVYQDQLIISTNDDRFPEKTVGLNGLWQKEGEGSKEPNAQTMITVFGFKSKVGFSGSDPDQGLASKPKGDEIISSYFLRADTTKPVYVRQMGAYHQCCSGQTETFRWFAKGSTTITGVFTHIAKDAQSLLPRRSSGGSFAEGSFSPTVPFGIRIGGKDHTDTLRNPSRKIGVRVWKAYDVDGKVIPNTYLVANDYLGTDVTNYDYNDNMYYVTNIRPEIGTVYNSALAATPSAVEFSETVLNNSSTFNLNLKSLGQVYANGTSDPAVSITSVILTGENMSEFSVAMPAKTTLAPQEATTIPVTFKPSTQGLKIADLLIYYSNMQSPLRVPLYGVAKASGTTVSVTHRIKAGSTSAVTVNGKTWSSDAAYAFDNLEPYTNTAVKSISASDDDVLYLREQSSNGSKKPFRYEIPLANGTYGVRLHFAEIYWGNPGTGFLSGEGSRVMSVSAEGQMRLPNIDIIQEVGAASALVKNLPVTITDGKLNLDFSATTDRPMLSAVEVYKFEPGSTAAAPATAARSMPQELATDNGLTKPRVYPNPVARRFTIEFPTDYEGLTHIQITDLAGRVYQAGRAMVSAGGTKLEMDITRHRLKSGIYLLRIVADNKATEIVKLVVE